MKISIDIGHPAHVHFFKHFIWSMQETGHEVFITAVDKDIACTLLESYGFAYINHGTYGRSTLRKLIRIPVMDYRLYCAARLFNPDIFLGLGSIRAAHTAYVMRRPCIIFDDTENANAGRSLYLPFTDFVCTPSCYKKELGRKQVRYNGYHELAYLHPNRFEPEEAILQKINLTKGDAFVVMRFVEWGAVHDIGHAGIGLELKRKAVKAYSEHARVLITSESPLPEDLEQYRIQIPPEEVHHLLAYATLLYGESATMASECAVLGTPSIYIDNVGRGYTDEQEKTYGSVFNFKETPDDIQASIRKGVEILTTPGIKAKWQEKSETLISRKIDVTAWMVDFVEKAVT